MSTDREPASGDPSGRADWMNRAANHRKTHLWRRPSLAERRRERLLLEWYGEARGLREIEALRSQPRPLAGVVDEVLRGIGLQDIELFDRVCREWADLVGADIARQAVPVSFHGGVLAVEVRSASWLYVLNNEHRDEIRGRLQRFAEGRVRDVRFVPMGRYGR
ncbi:MAG: DUF721 domain-containing protein [Lentisphaeria bacterium]|nr:DUF721 domain-containing protein [Lentisphaeria bacterium]